MPIYRASLIRVTGQNRDFIYNMLYYSSWGLSRRKKLRKWFKKIPRQVPEGRATLRTGFIVINPTFFVKRYFKTRIKLFRAELIRCASEFIYYFGLPVAKSVHVFLGPPFVFIWYCLKYINRTYNVIGFMATREKNYFTYLMVKTSFSNLQQGFSWSAEIRFKFYKLLTSNAISIILIITK